MCELFGYSGQMPLNITPYLKVLASHSHDHPHGWGIANLFDNFVNVEKEAKSAWISDYLNSRLQAPMIVTGAIAHIRQATRGDMTYANCHPFVQRDKHNKAWTLAHNGTIFKSEGLGDYSEIQIGNTDSEAVLCEIVHRSNEMRDPANFLSCFQMLDKLIQDIAADNKLNLLIYDGTYFYVHTNMKGTLYQRQLEDGMLFATVPLDDAPWQPVPMLQLLVYRKGQLIFQGTKHSHEYKLPALADDPSLWTYL